MDEARQNDPLAALWEYCVSLESGPVSDTEHLERLLSEAWGYFGADKGAMTGYKLHGRTEEMEYRHPCIRFSIERHGAVKFGSTRGEVQRWEVDVEKGTARLLGVSGRQIQPMQPPLNVKPVAEELAERIVSGREDERLKRYEDGRVKLLIGEVVPGDSAPKETVRARRKRLRLALEERLSELGWDPCAINVYRPRVDDGDDC